MERYPTLKNVELFSPKLLVPPNTQKGLFSKQVAHVLNLDNMSF